MAHVIIHDGVIVRSSDMPFVDKEYGASEFVDYDVVWQNGGLYKAGEEPKVSVPTLTEMQATKRNAINAGFDAAMTASLTIPSATPTPSAFAVYQAIEKWKAEDPEGYSTLLTIHEARRASLLAAVDAATTVDAVQAITVSYAV